MTILNFLSVHIYVLKYCIFILEWLKKKINISQICLNIFEFLNMLVLEFVMNISITFWFICKIYWDFF